MLTLDNLYYRISEALRPSNLLTYDKHKWENPLSEINISFDKRKVCWKVFLNTCHVFFDHFLICSAKIFILAAKIETCWIRTAHPDFSTGGGEKKKKKVGSHSPVFPSPLSIAHLVVSDWLFTLASGRARQRQTVRQTHTNCRSKDNNLAPW